MAEGILHYRRRGRIALEGRTIAVVSATVEGSIVRRDDNENNSSAEMGWESMRGAIYGRLLVNQICEVQLLTYRGPWNYRKLEDSLELSLEASTPERDTDIRIEDFQV